MKRLLIMLAAAAFLTVAVTGCNTVKGAGQDIENTGEAFQDWVQ